MGPMNALTLPARWWIIPVLAITVTAIPNGILIFLAFSRPLAKADEHPYAASARVDADRAALAALVATGGGVVVTVTPRTVEITWRGPVTGQRTVELQRTSDSARDRRLTWTDGDTLRVEALEPGPWRVRVRQDQALLVDQRCDLP